MLKIERLLVNIVSDGYQWLTTTTNPYDNNNLNVDFSNYDHRILGGNGDILGPNYFGDSHDNSTSYVDDVHHEEHFGVHVKYEDIWNAIIFFMCIYIGGQIASRLLRMPNLVGEIIVGILLGPPLADFVPNPEAFVLFGEIGLVLLVLEAGIDVDITTLKLIGTRGVLIAIVGSLLPMAIGIGLALAMGTDTKGAIAAGAAFAPTSLGIALNILKSGGILNTPVGQLVISAAVIDDMIALIILSQLEGLTGEITAKSMLIPVISALAFLIIGGYIALEIAPKLINKYILNSKYLKDKQEMHGKVEMAIMFVLMVGLMPATYYAEASFLMGAFIAGLAFCRSHELHHMFQKQFKRVLQWLMRIFFAASIGFQVPILDFGNGTVIWQGLVFTLALTGKLAVGSMVPNFNQVRRFTGIHLRDSMIVGFSMAAEGEFAFVIAVFAADAGLISKELYASVVLAVLLSTIFPPFMLRFTISRWNKKAEEGVRKAAEDELKLRAEQKLEEGKVDQSLTQAIKEESVIFLCIQTQSVSKWGLLHSLMNQLSKIKLEIIDHRSWHPRGVDTTLVNEIYAKDIIKMRNEDNQTVEIKSIDARITEVQESIAKVMPPDSRVKVTRWYPGVVEEIVEESIHKPGEDGTKKVKSRISIEDRVLQEASKKLEHKQNLSMAVTRQRTVKEIMAEMKHDVAADIAKEKEESQLGGGDANGTTATATTVGDIASAEAGEEKPKPKRRQRIRQKMRSTPVVGGGLFESPTDDTAGTGAPKDKTAITRDNIFGGTFESSSGHTADLIINGDTYKVRITDETLRNVQLGYQGQEIKDGAIQIAPATPVVNRLSGYVRSNMMTLSQISEQATADDKSEISQDSNHDALKMM